MKESERLRKENDLLQRQIEGQLTDINKQISEYERYLIEELKKAHQDYEERKNEILTKLQTMKSIPTLLQHERMWLDQAIEFIKEKEI